MEAKQRAMRISWVFRIENDPFLSNVVYTQVFKGVGNQIWRCNLKKSDAKKLFTKGNWLEILEMWCELNFETDLDCNGCTGYVGCKYDNSDQILWANSLVRINNKPVIWQEWINRGIWQVNDIVNVDLWHL